MNFGASVLVMLLLTVLISSLVVLYLLIVHVDSDNQFEQNTRVQSISKFLVLVSSIKEAADS